LTLTGWNCPLVAFNALFATVSIVLGDDPAGFKLASIIRLTPKTVSSVVEYNLGLLTRNAHICSEFGIWVSRIDNPHERVQGFPVTGQRPRIDSFDDIDVHVHCSVSLDRKSQAINELGMLNSLASGYIHGSGSSMAILDEDIGDIYRLPSEKQVLSIQGGHFDNPGKIL
jgi:hypothetical protein